MLTRYLMALLVLPILPPVASADLPPLIPRTTLFGNPEKAGPQISPDAKFLSWLAPDKNDVLQVWVKPLEGKGEPKMVTDDKKRGIRQYFWTYRPEELIYLQDQAGDEDYHLFLVNVRTAAVKELTPFKGVRAQGVDLDHKHPNEVLVGLNKRDQAKFDVYRLNLETGKEELDTENPGNVVGWTADAEFQIRAALAATPDGGYDLRYRAGPKADWKTLRHWGSEDQGAPVGFSTDGKTLYLQANHDANTSRMLALDLASGKEKVVAQDENYDIGGVMFHPTKRVPQAVAFMRDKLSWQVLDNAITADFKMIRADGAGQFSVASRSLDDKKWIVAYTLDNGPTSYALYERLQEETKSGNRIEGLFVTQPKLEKLRLSTMKPITYQARDGLTVHGYLTTPIGIEAKNLPTVLLVHGGPWARDSWGFNAQAQWLANRGYAVLQVNFRGSTGYGKKFLNAGNKEWGAKMQDDLTDAVKWLVKEGVADAKKVAIMGGSYGGYATLAGLAFTPDVYACGVDIVGPSNISSLLKAIPPYWAPMKAMFSKRVGDVEKEQDFLKSRSPLFHVEKIKVPLLIGQGANDPRVKQAESDQIVEALRKANKTVEYVLYTDEGHGFARPENRLHFYAVAEQFLARHLGGRAEPLGEIKGHSGQVK